MKRLLVLIIVLTPILLLSFPIDDFNYHTPNNSISPYSAGLGGINLTSARDNLAFYDNPALLKAVRQMTFTATFSIPNKEIATNNLLNAKILTNDSKFKAFGIQAQNIGFLYYELANDRFDKKEELERTYQDYTLRSIGLSIADTASTKLNWGLSLRYLNGRLVYLKEAQQDSVYTVSEFIDSNANGYATDIGVYGKQFGFYYGFVVHDLFSKIYWNGYANTRIHTRGSFSAELRSNNTSFTSSVTSLWNIHETPIFTQSINYSKRVGNPNRPQDFSLRMGATSTDYKSSENIMFSFGTSYMIRMLRVDLAMQTKGLKINTAQYIFSLSAGA
ncbi:MAG: hypothetical protein LHW49_01555 [Candidatus Cloacimonetes bacterium]|nr:hypothetical protein [Candidatus Cloacimonadota bacterium]MDD3502072.1 hypothetical protein [Candidatus Cloacimonadota bacterium]